MGKKLSIEEIYRRCPDLELGQIYTGIFEKMIFVCPVHGSYQQSVSSYLQGQRCSKCKQIYRYRYCSDLKPGQKYTNDGHSKMIFICPLHGPYWQRISNHQQGKGCSECGRIKTAKAITIQKLGEPFTFPCGCSGILPVRGSNKFAIQKGRSFCCRVSSILSCGSRDAQYGGYKFNCIPHSIIRRMMERQDCWRCREPLDWVFGSGRTPHLHHDHETGKILGFTHPKCNSCSLDNDELKCELAKINSQIELRVQAAIKIAIEQTTEVVISKLLHRDPFTEFSILKGEKCSLVDLTAPNSLIRKMP
jgi:hypothetical protein